MRPLASLAPDDFETGALGVMRALFATFASPAHHHWRRAIALAQASFGAWAAGERFFGAVEAVEAMRQARTSPFVFSPGHCPSCATAVTGDEVLAMMAPTATRRA